MAVTVGSAILEAVSVATAGEIAASTALTIAAFGIGVAAEIGVSIGLSYDAPAVGFSIKDTKGQP